MNEKYRVGQIRPSQVLWTYGPGAIIDLPNMSVVTMGLEFWDTGAMRSIEEKRLLHNIQRILGPQVAELCSPPMPNEEPRDKNSAAALVGLSVRPFPRWLRCVKCGLLAECDSGLFEIIANNYYPEQTRFVHKNCPKAKNAKGSDAVPARFLVACKAGHLDDFPWRWFVHSGKSDCGEPLYFYEDKASLQTENLWVKCGCGAARSMTHAFGQEGAENLPGCRGRHAHLNKFTDGCEEKLRTIVLGSSSSWFPNTVSVLSLPVMTQDPVEIVNGRREEFDGCETVDEIEFVLKLLEKRGKSAELKKFTAQEVFDILTNKSYESSETSIITDADVKPPEWDVLTSPDPPSGSPHFLAKQADRVPRKFADKISRVVLIERLRKVNALIGFTRIESLNEFVEGEEDHAVRAPLSKDKPTWVPACEVFGEGVFIQFSENALSSWEKLEEVQRRDRMLRKGQTGWNNARKLEGETGYPGIRYVMLHTLAHLIVREFALECGYNAASIQERIYATSAQDEKPMAGVLLYTAAADSDGTLGGLVELGKPDSLERILELALKRAAICSADPLCAEHDPTEDNSLHGAACHSCSYISETSCEIGNRYLDRALVVKTFDCEKAAFFGEQ